MTIFKITDFTIMQAGRLNSPKATPPRPSDDAETGPASRALVPVEPISRAPHPRLHTTRPDASFVTHLIATAEQAPQTRTLRRATSSDAVGLYGRVIARPEAARPNIAKLSRLA